MSTAPTNGSRSFAGRVAFVTGATLVADGGQTA
jgi:hypothetical protein